MPDFALEGIMQPVATIGRVSSVRFPFWQVSFVLTLIHFPNNLGDDGAPVDNCDNQFCMYQIDGTFSYDTATQGFTRHEWGGTSYHQNLLGYGEFVFCNYCAVDSCLLT